DQPEPRVPGDARALHPTGPPGASPGAPGDRPHVAASVRRGPRGPPGRGRAGPRLRRFVVPATSITRPGLRCVRRCPVYGEPARGGRRRPRRGPVVATGRRLPPSPGVAGGRAPARDPQAGGRRGGGLARGPVVAAARMGIASSSPYPTHSGRWKIGRG